MTGIAPDTLRVWEKRYGFPQPQRVGKGVRVYSDQDIEKLRIASSLLELGYRPGDVLGRSVEELRPLLASNQSATPSNKTRSGAPTIEQVLQFLTRYDIGSISQALVGARESFGLVRFVRDFARPLMERVGDLWAEKNLEIRHEHLISELLGTELRMAIAELREGEGPRVLLATLPSEQHGLGLDLWAAELVGLGLSPYVLGIDLPIEQIAKTAVAVDAKVVAIFLSNVLSREASEGILAELVPQLPRRILVWLGGRGAEQLASIPDGARRFDHYSQYDTVASELLRANRKSVGA